jgi:RimJ/RimL family protein N-acetyltransferase
VVDIPRLETERLILRAHRLEDFEAGVRIWSDPVVVKHFHGPAMTREDHWGRFLRQFGMWEVMGYGAWAVEEKASGDYLGTVGVFEVKRTMDPNMEGVPEAGWTLAAHAHGKGYATEAMRAAIAWIDEKLGKPRLFCIIAPGNRPSIRVAEKLGFRYWRDTTYKEQPTLIYLREHKGT